MDDGGLSKGQLKKIKQKLAAAERCAYGHVVLYIHYILIQHRQGKLKQKECNHTVMACIRALQKHKLFEVQHVQTVMTELKQDIQSDVDKEKNQSMSELLQKESSLLQDELSTILNKDDEVIAEASKVDNEEKLSLLIKTTSLLRKCCRYFTESAFVEYDAEVLITTFSRILEKWSSITDRSLTSSSRLQQLRSTSTHLEEAVSCDEIADLVQERDNELSKSQKRRRKKKAALERISEQAAYGHVVKCIHFILFQFGHGEWKVEEFKHTVLEYLRALRKHRFYNDQHLEYVIQVLQQEEMQSDVAKEESKSMLELLDADITSLQTQTICEWNDKFDEAWNEWDKNDEENSGLDSNSGDELLIKKTISSLKSCCSYIKDSVIPEYDVEVLHTAYPGMLEKLSNTVDLSLTSRSEQLQLSSTAATHVEATTAHNEDTDKEGQSEKDKEKKAVTVASTLTPKITSSQLNSAIANALTSTLTSIDSAESKSPPKSTTTSTSTHKEETFPRNRIKHILQNMVILPVSLDIGEYKFSPGSTYGEGVCWCTRFGKMLECSLEFFLDDERGNSYLGNLFTCHHQPNIIGCVYDTEQSGLQIFALERYHRTLRDFTADSTFLWGINKHNEATFSAFLSNTVLQLLSVIEFLVAKEIYVDDFGLGHVVYAASDLKLETPKLRHIFCFDQEKKPKDYCQYYLSCLRSMIEEMASNLKLSHDAGKFLECLTNSSMSLKRLQNHPVFWCKLMKLDYVRNQLKDHTLRMEEDDTARFEACVGDWMTKVKANPDLSGSMAVYFWRNTFEHLFDSNPSELEKRAKVEELMVSTLPTFVDYLYSEIGLDMNIKRDNSLKCDRPIIKLNINVPNEPDNM